MEIQPIGRVSSARTDPSDTTGWGDVVARIDLIPELGTESLTGLADFSHVDVVYWFDQITRRPSYAGLSRARGRDDMPPIGAFASRGPHRPNPIAVSACRIVEVGDTWLTVLGLDAVDGTPVLDLKAVQPRLLPTDVREPEWSAVLMHDYYERDEEPEPVPSGPVENHRFVDPQGPEPLPQGWYRDPFGRHEARWISQGRPTDLVRDGAAEQTDPPPTETIDVDALQPIADSGAVYDDLARADDPPKVRNAADGSGSLGIGFQ